MKIIAIAFCVTLSIGYGIAQDLIKCEGNKKDGSRSNSTKTESKRYCPLHSPEAAQCTGTKNYGQQCANNLSTDKTTNNADTIDFTNR